jgi:predicted enzyme related to lactoylglutathione lyase
MYVKFATLPVDDADRAIAFYTGKLRLTLTTDAAMDNGGRWIELALPEGKTSLLVEPGRADRDRTQPVLILVVPDVDMAFERLDALGVEFTVQPVDAPWLTGTRYAMFRDSEDNMVMLSDDA